ncbi:MAG: hypothetical protein VX956_02595 [Gemmatimonadota bacterium]|nr:hypothetical protein [Gemmatimonadota bacterium]
MRTLACIAMGVVAASSLMPSAAAAQQPTVHVLEGGPTTVAWGYYWSEAPPVLRIESGDIVEMSTFLTSSPDRLERAGIPPEQVEPALRAVYAEVTERGPGDAYQLISVACDLRITQLVDRKVGVHVMIPKSLF